MNTVPGIFLAFAFAPLVLLCSTANAADLDGDGISDEIENQLLQRFAPILYPNEIHNEPEGGAAVPVSISWLLRNSRMTFYDRAISNWVVVLDRPSLSSAVTFVNGSANGAKNFSLRNYHLWGDSPGDVRSWPISITRGEGVYGRVWKPWPNPYPQIYSLQYFVLLTWNETAYSGDYGNHEGDWLCVDYAVDVRCGFENPPIIHAVYHNHGQQMFVTPELLELENGHPVVYVEKGTNEAWPNRGTRGKAGWPRSNGFATSKDWDDNDNPFLSEYGVHREHDGNGNRYATHDVPNIGDVNPTNGPVSLCGDEGVFLLKYQGVYGFETVDVFDLIGVTNPEGPPWQAKMWNRAWTEGTWFLDRLPFSADTSGFRLYTTVVYSSTTPPVPVETYTFTVPQLRNPAYADLRAVREGNGSSELPYRNLLLGIAMTDGSGTLVIQPGNFSLPFEIKQPITLTAPNGVVTIGQ